jgi:hypothetical protein
LALLYPDPDPDPDLIDHNKSVPDPELFERVGFGSGIISYAAPDLRTDDLFDIKPVNFFEY